MNPLTWTDDLKCVLSCFTPFVAYASSINIYVHKCTLSEEATRLVGSMLD